MQDLQVRFAEMENIWLFFQRFADEQGNDKIKICRALYPTVLQKLNAMEWLARYIEFLTPDCIALASNYIKEHYADPRSKVTLEFISYEHTSEAIPTVIQKLKTKDSEFNVGACDFKQYDEACSMLLMILEPLTVNDCNVEMMVKTDALDVVCDVMLCQRLYSDLEGGKDGKKRDPEGRLIKIEHDVSLLSHTEQVKYEDWATKNRTIKVMLSFRYTLRVIASILRDDESLKQFLDTVPYLRKVFLVAEEMADLETVSNCMKIFRLSLRTDWSQDQVMLRFPSLLNFILFLLNKYSSTTPILSEGLVALRSVSKKSAYTSLLKKEALVTFQKLCTLKHTPANESHLTHVLKNLAKNPGTEAHLRPLNLGKYYKA